jgi:small conductance mechanosensitive channel
MPKWELIIQKITVMAVQYVPKVLLGILTLVIGFWVAKVLTKILRKSLERAKVEITLLEFLTSIISIGLKVLVIISVATMVGVQMTSFIAILSAMAFAIGLAFQGSLSNFSGGVLIILLKPFKSGDFIEAQGYMGTVDSIQIFHTILKTVDNKKIIIPNGPLSNGNIVNYTAQETRRNEWIFGIGYGDDFEKAKRLILDILEADERILKDPAPFARVGELASSSVNIKARAWIPLTEFWNVHFDVLEKVKKSFDENGIHIPFPQTDVHIIEK